eukprot:89982-Chlamydomonas_euryale.AAC.1
MWKVFHDAPQRLPLPDGQTTPDGWMIVFRRATPLTACAQAASVHAVAGIHAELQAFVRAFHDSPPAPLRTCRQTTRFCAFRTGGCSWWDLSLSRI